MSGVCSKCGLLADLCVCETLDKEKTRKIRVYLDKKKFRKYMTVVEGIDKGRVKETAAELKRRFACGGTFKEGTIYLQGDHMRKILSALVSIGYPEEVIDVEQ